MRRRHGESLTLSRRLVKAVREQARQPLPENVAQAARLHFVDALGVGLAAAGSPVGQPYRSFSNDLHEGKATIVGQRKGAAPADAALVNGGLMHSLEFDDTHTGSIMHGSSVMAAAALAAAQGAGASGQALLGAYARGWEVLIRFGIASPGGFHARGFQATSVAGTLSAALAAAELNALTEDQTVAALGIALSQGSGVMEFLSNGSSVKSLHSGWAAHGGLLAAQLARAGLTGPETALEGRWGLFKQFAADDKGAARFEALLATLGREWHLPQAAFKFYPCCHYLHPFIEAAGKLADQGVKASEVERILCLVPAGAAPVICEPWERALDPPTGHAARWSLPITVAARLVDGSVTLETFEHSASTAIRALARKVRWEPLKEARFPERFEAVVSCETTTGKTYSVRIDDVDGNHTRPPSADRVLAKFRANAARSLTPQGVDALAAATGRLPAAHDLSDIRQALAQLH